MGGAAAQGCGVQGAAKSIFVGGKMDFMHSTNFKLFSEVKLNSISLLCSIFLAFIRCIKCMKYQQMHFNFTDVLFLYYGQQHVSATHAAIFRVIALRTIQ